MLIKATKIFLISAVFLVLNNCAEPSSNKVLSQSVKTNIVTIDNLKTLIKDHPELSSASLKIIKNSAEKKSVKALSLSTAPGAESEKPLDPEIAKKAQTLIDKILDDFDLREQLNAQIKITGIVLNEQRIWLDKMKQAKTKLKQEFNEPEHKELPTCEDFVADPFNGISQELVGEILARNHKEIKKHLSGCAEIIGQDFVKCMQNLNHMTMVINQYANCDMNNFEALDSIIERELKQSLEEIQKSAELCMNQEFISCGYEPEKVGKISETPDT